jgi:tetratricopeptide (TPR) repeat protein
VERALQLPARGTAPTWLVCALLVLCVLVVYAQTLGFGFVGYDDPEYVLNNERVLRGLSWDGLRWALGSFFAANWFPLTWLSLMLDAEIAGAAPRMFHLTNLLLHAASTLLLFRVLDRATVLLELGWTEEAIDRWLQLVAARPQATAALCNLCGALARAGRLAEAQPRCGQALRSNPQAACAHASLGQLYLRQSRILEAEQHLETAVRIAPGDTNARLSLADALAAQGRLSDASAQYAEVLRLDPGNATARASLDAIRLPKSAD